jgi:hypothetical protein
MHVFAKKINITSTDQKLIIRYSILAPSGLLGRSLMVHSKAKVKHNGDKAYSATVPIILTTQRQNYW